MVPVPLCLLGAAAFLFGHDLSPSSERRSPVLGVMVTLHYPGSGGYSCMNLSFPACALTLVTSFSMQVAVNQPRFLIHEASTETCSVPHPELG